MAKPTARMLLRRRQRSQRGRNDDILGFVYSLQSASPSQMRLYLSFASHAISRMVLSDSPIRVIIPYSYTVKTSIVTPWSWQYCTVGTVQGFHYPTRDNMEPACGASLDVGAEDI